MMLGPKLADLPAWELHASGGSLAGHLIECGPQATGGLLTDWQDMPSWEDLGYPIVQVRANGSIADL